MLAALVAGLKTVERAGGSLMGLRRYADVYGLCLKRVMMLEFKARFTTVLCRDVTPFKPEKAQGKNNPPPLPLPTKNRKPS